MNARSIRVAKYSIIFIIYRFPRAIALGKKKKIAAERLLLAELIGNSGIVIDDINDDILQYETCSIIVL